MLANSPMANGEAMPKRRKQAFILGDRRSATYTNGNPSLGNGTLGGSSSVRSVNAQQRQTGKPMQSKQQKTTIANWINPAASTEQTASSAIAPAWYAVSVAPGTELQAVEVLRAQLLSTAPALKAECFAPLYRTSRKVAGEYVEEGLPLIPGCICVVCEPVAGVEFGAAECGDAAGTVCAADVADTTVATLQVLRAVVRKCGVGTSARFAVEPLHEVVAEWLQACTTPGNRVVDASVGVARDGSVRVTAGPLSHKEQWIRKVNHRKKCAYLDIPAGARNVQAQSGLKLARA